VKIGIIGAMDEEIKNYLIKLKNQNKIKTAGFIYYKGVLLGNNIILVKSGAGKVNASMCTQQLISKFKVDYIIFTGVAGAINPKLNIFDIVVSRDCAQHDINTKKLGFKNGQIPFTKMTFFKTPQHLIKVALNSAKKIGIKAIAGRILTGDQFITNKIRTKNLIKEFEGDCVDMESAAAAYVCYLNKIHYLAIRSISDRADHSASIDFKDFLNKASKNSFLLVTEIIKKLNKK